MDLATLCPLTVPDALARTVALAPDVEAIESSEAQISRTIVMKSTLSTRFAARCQCADRSRGRHRSAARNRAR